VFVRDLLNATMTLVSVAWNGTPGNGRSFAPSISEDGRFVAFVSSATDLVPEGTSGELEIFLRDLVSATTRRVSVASNEESADDTSYSPQISANGQFVTYWSFATNLVPNDDNDRGDVFLRDLENSTTTLVSVTKDEGFGDGTSSYPSINANGTLVAFASAASNLVLGDTNGVQDVFVRNVKNQTTIRVSTPNSAAASNGDSSAPSITADGAYVAFESAATNLVSNDTNDQTDIFVADVAHSSIRRVSLSTSGEAGNAASTASSISGDGRWVAYQSMASNLIANDTGALQDVFLRDLENSITSRLSVNADGEIADGVSSTPTLNADGGLVAFSSRATNLVPDDTDNFDDIFVAPVVQ
jgi:Tol biopolymer transport system component